VTTFKLPSSSNECWAKHPSIWLRCRAAARESRLPRGVTRPDPNDPDGRSSQMLLFFLVAAPEIETPERAQWRDLPGCAKQYGAAMNANKPQPPRSRMI
jgi:hypothetical protein